MKVFIFALASLLALSVSEAISLAAPYLKVGDTVVVLTSGFDQGRIGEVLEVGDAKARVVVYFTKSQFAKDFSVADLSRLEQCGGTPRVCKGDKVKLTDEALKQTPSNISPDSIATVQGFFDFGMVYIAFDNDFLLLARSEVMTRDLSAKKRVVAFKRGVYVWAESCQYVNVEPLKVQADSAAKGACYEAGYTNCTTKNTNYFESRRVDPIGRNGSMVFGPERGTCEIEALVHGS